MDWNNFWRIAITLISLGMSGCQAGSAPPPVEPHSMLIGTNVNALRDWGTSFPFIDVFHSSRPLDTEGGGGVLLDRRGWIRRLDRGRVAVSPVLFDIQPGRLPAGDYTVLYDGDGKLEFGCARLKRLDRSARRAVIAIDGKSDCGLYLKILSSAEDNPVRDIRVIMPGGICAKDPFTRVESASACPKGAYRAFADHDREWVFNPDYLRYLRHFSVARFMDAMETNSRDHVQRHWSDRPTPSDATWQNRGWPVEIMVALANRAEVDPWFTLPHAADDDYIRRFARYVKDHLDPARKVYIEYSNEVWNGIFPQSEYALKMGKKLGLDRNEYYAAWKFYSRRSVEIFTLWDDVFGADQRNRLVHVMATQASNPGMTRMLLDYRQAWKKTDALAVAAYFGGEAGVGDVRQVENMSQARFIRYLEKTALPRIFDEYRMNAKIAAKYHLPLVAYEGGQHLVGVGPAVDNPGLKEKFIAANRSPEMERLYLTMYRGWKAAGGQLFMHYADPAQYSKWGSWGVKEYLAQPDEQAPKYRATIKMSRRGNNGV
ncbi:MAG TPA: hypothetical protein ENK26_06685 [Gammaproteobacteria bacterium]|nr:hypothetical protein [Gammaproteobacteria bacterium]